MQKHRSIKGHFTSTLRTPHRTFRRQKRSENLMGANLSLTTFSRPTNLPSDETCLAAPSPLQPLLGHWVSTCVQRPQKSEAPVAPPISRT